MCRRSDPELGPGRPSHLLCGLDEYETFEPFGAYPGTMCQDSPTKPAVVGVQIDVAAADDRDHVAAGEAVPVLQDGGDAQSR